MVFACTGCHLTVKPVLCPRVCFAEPTDAPTRKLCAAGPSDPEHAVAVLSAPGSTPDAKPPVKNTGSSSGPGGALLIAGAAAAALALTGAAEDTLGGVAEATGAVLGAVAEGSGAAVEGLAGVAAATGSALAAAIVGVASRICCMCGASGQKVVSHPQRPGQHICYWHLGTHNEQLIPTEQQKHAGCCVRPIVYDPNDVLRQGRTGTVNQRKPPIVSEVDGYVGLLQGSDGTFQIAATMPTKCHSNPVSTVAVKEMRALVMVCCVIHGYGLSGAHRYVAYALAPACMPTFLMEHLFTEWHAALHACLWNVLNPVYHHRGIVALLC